LLAYAAKNSQTVDFSQSVQVGSTTVPAGPVKVTWNGTASAATPTVAALGKNPIAVPAEIVNQKNAHRHLDDQGEMALTICRTLSWAT
jgi:hypothetical protein